MSVWGWQNILVLIFLTGKFINMPTFKWFSMGPPRAPSKNQHICFISWYFSCFTKDLDDCVCPWLITLSGGVCCRDVSVTRKPVWVCCCCSYITYSFPTINCYQMASSHSCGVLSPRATLICFFVICATVTSRVNQFSKNNKCYSSSMIRFVSVWFFFTCPLF